MTKLLGVGGEFFGMEFYKDHGNFVDDNDEVICRGIAYYGNKGHFNTMWVSQDLNLLQYWLDNIKLDTNKKYDISWNSEDYECTSYYMEDSIGKFVEWYYNLEDFNHRTELHHAIDKEQYDRIKWHEGEDITDYHCHSGYKGHLPEKMIFYYDDCTYDLFEKKYNNDDVYVFFSGKFSKRVLNNIKNGEISTDYYDSLIFTDEIKKRMRKTTKEKVGNTPQVLFDQKIIDRGIDVVEAINRWKMLIK